jgi:hypothetical protein
MMTPDPLRDTRGTCKLAKIPGCLKILEGNIHLRNTLSMMYDGTTSVLNEDPIAMVAGTETTGTIISPHNFLTIGVRETIQQLPDVPITPHQR